MKKKKGKAATEDASKAEDTVVAEKPDPVAAEDDNVWGCAPAKKDKRKKGKAATEEVLPQHTQTNASINWV